MTLYTKYASLLSVRNHSVFIVHACVHALTSQVGILSLRYSSKLEVPLVSIARRGLRNEFPPNSKCLKISVVLINTKIGVHV